MTAPTIAGKVICSGFAACFAWLFGSFDINFQTLLFFVVADFLFGTMYAFQSHTVASRKAWDGMVKKILTLCVVAIAFQIDKLVGTDGTIRLVAIYGFIGSELYSIIENLGLLGLKIPANLLQYFNAFIEKTKTKGEEENNG